MIPRFKPYLKKEELLAALIPARESVKKFEEEFAKMFDAKYAIAFPYGRSALWSFFKAMKIEGAEVIMPAYTCVVVAHAIVLSGNIPRFVDITLSDYNMDLEQVAQVINEKTKAIIPTNLFGYPVDIEKLDRIVKEAEKRFGNKIWVIQDCAHAFGVKWNENFVCSAGDIAIFGLNISKMITSIFGGMLTTNDFQLYEKIKNFRDTHFKKPGFFKTLKRFFYLLAVYLAFNERFYRIVYLLQEKTSILNKLTKAYHLDNKIHFPPDYLDQMLPIEARVGLVQLTRYPEIVKKRKEIAYFYHQNLFQYSGWVKPPIVEGATYSHYVVRVPNKEKIINEIAKRGIQLGRLIEYSIPELKEYQKYTKGIEYPNSKLCSLETINLPVYYFLNKKKLSIILSILNKYLIEVS
jgi:dTDP-4-amino-4,6-dideoxygalactose transaminase